MNDFEENDYEQKDSEELIQRFQDMINGEATYYFDSEELEIIVNELLEDMDLPLAEEAVEYAVKQYPTDSYFRLMRVRLLILDASLEEAESELDEIEASFPLTHEFYLEKVLLLRILEKDEDVLELLEKAYVLAPDDPEVLLSLIYEAISRNEMDKAVKYMETAIEADDSFEEKLFTIANYIEENENLDCDDAIKFFSSLTNKFPLCTGAWFALGSVYKSAGQFEKAIEAYLYTLSTDDNALVAYYNIGNAYFEMGEYEKAREAYLKNLKDDSTDYLTLNAIAHCYQSENNETEALRYFQKSFNINENNPGAIIGITTIFINLKKTEELLIFINKAIELDADSYQLFSLTAPYLIEGQHIGQLKHLFYSALNQVIDNEEKEELIYSFGELCCENEHYNVGIEVLENKIEEDDEEDDEEVMDAVYYVLAALYFLNNQPKEGEKYLELALIMNFVGYTDFIELHPDLESNPSVKKLVKLHNPF